MKKNLTTLFVVLSLLLATHSITFAQTITGLGIIGDDFSDEYRANDDRGGEFSTFTKNWVEQLVQYRSINVGEWACYSDARRCGYEYNWSHTGATAKTAIDEGQHTSLAQQISEGKVSDAVIAIGNNDYTLSSDFYSGIYNQRLTSPEINARETQIINSIQTAIQTIHDAGNVNIIVILLNDPGNTRTAGVSFPDAIKRNAVTTSIDRVNTAVSEFATNLNAVVIDPNTYETTLLSSANGNGELTYGNATLQTFTNGNDPHFFHLDDNLLPGTVYSGLIANDFFIKAEVLAFGKNMTPFSENEILTHAGLDLNNLTPTSTPPNGQPTVCDTDINQDGIVDVTDYGEILVNYLRDPILNNRADINKDGVVDISDHAHILQFYMQTCSQ